MTDKGKPAG